MHRFLLHNDTIRDASEPCLSPGQVALMTGWGVFSTMRVSRGVLFEYPRHFARMQRDARLTHVPMPEDPAKLEDALLRLLDANQAFDATLRVNILRNNGGVFSTAHDRPYDIVAFTSSLMNWGESVRLGVVEQARHGANVFAGTKVTSWGFNLTWHEQAHLDGFDEVVLLDETGGVSECTSANIFAVFGNDIVTPPLSSGCLPGITRELLLRDISCAPFAVTERAFPLKDLYSADSVFITSTTRDVLPVWEVDSKPVRQKPELIAALQQNFREYLAGYVAKHTPALSR